MTWLPQSQVTVKLQPFETTDTGLHPHLVSIDRDLKVKWRSNELAFPQVRKAFFNFLVRFCFSDDPDNRHQIHKMKKKLYIFIYTELKACQNGKLHEIPKNILSRRWGHNLSRVVVQLVNLAAKWCLKKLPVQIRTPIKRQLLSVPFIVMN